MADRKKIVAVYLIFWIGFWYIRRDSTIPLQRLQGFDSLSGFYDNRIQNDAYLAAAGNLDTVHDLDKWDVPSLVDAYT